MHLNGLRVVFIVLVILASGCSTYSDSSPSDGLGQMLLEPTSVQINSKPSGADVYVMGKKVGETPMRISSSAPYPENYNTANRSLYGKIILRKEGCKDLIESVSNKSISSGINAVLDCNNGNNKATEHRANPVAPGHVAKGQFDALKQRLEEVKKLEQEGLITKDEAGKARSRILKGL